MLASARTSSSCSARTYTRAKARTAQLLAYRHTPTVHRLVYQGTLASSSISQPGPSTQTFQNFDLKQRQRELVPSDAQRQTIYALSTPPGKAGVAVVRVSGPDALEVRKRMVRPARTKSRGTHAKIAMRRVEPWKMERCTIVHPVSNEMLDDGLVVFFRGPRSFTTEDVLELHIHSGRALIAAVLGALAQIPCCRPAAPGEFTRRAFEGGRLDLTQVEGLRDLVDAETEGQRKAALRVAGGAARAEFEKLREDMIGCLALVEAIIDFGEGEEIEDGVFEQARDRARQLRDRIHAILSDKRRGEIMRSGARLAIFGPPNAGKSSLLNFLAQREAAIVTHIPGTTRDILELSLDIGGLPVIVADTAGLRATEDVVESIGVGRAKDTVQAADVSLLVLSAPDVLVQTPTGPQLVIPPDVKPLVTADTFVLLNKLDLLPAGLTSDTLDAVSGAAKWVVSLTSGEGTSEFLSGLAAALQKRYDLIEGNSTEETLLITHARHRTHLESALAFVDAFLETGAEDVVLGAEELRYAAQAVGKISGLVDVEDVLDVVFRDFCIGK